MSKRALRRSAKTGQTVTPEYAAANPDETVTETIRPNPIPAFIENVVAAKLSQDTLEGLIFDVKRDESGYEGKALLLARLEYWYSRAMD